MDTIQDRVVRCCDRDDIILVDIGNERWYLHHSDHIVDRTGVVTLLMTLALVKLDDKSITLLPTSVR